MTFAEILRYLAFFAVAFAVLGVLYGRRKRKRVHPVRAALGGLLAFAVLSGVLALPVTFIVAVMEVQP
jgi:H+/Cl- antiporter ClcA